MAAPIVERHAFLRFDDPSYTYEVRAGFEARYQRLRDKAISNPSSCDFSIFNQIDEGNAANDLDNFMTMTFQHGRSQFISRVWHRLFEIRGVLIVELVQEFFSTLEFYNAPVDLRREGTITFQLGGIPRSMSMENFILALGLHTQAEVRRSIFNAYFTHGQRHCPSRALMAEYWSTISNAPFAGSPSYSLIREPIKRLVHRFLAFSISARSESREKVNIRDLWYLSSMDGGPIINVPWCLAEFLRTSATGSKPNSKIVGGQFVAALAAHFNLYDEGRLAGCTTVTPRMGTIGIRGLEKFNVIARDPTGIFRWTAPIPPLGNADEDTESEEEEPAPAHVPLHPRTHGDRLDSLEASVHGLQREIADQREQLYDGFSDMYGFTSWAEEEFDEASQEREEQRRYREWDVAMTSLQLERAHIDHTRFDGSEYHYAPPQFPPPPQFSPTIRYPLQRPAHGGYAFPRPPPQSDPRDVLGLFSGLPSSSTSGYGTTHQDDDDPMDD